MAVTFEVERFEWADDDRLELEGRWFGPRGRRFSPPTLDVEGDGESRRLLALMEHKPWAALDGEDWQAAFAWEGERGDIAAELAGGADLSFQLPRPGARGFAEHSARRKPSRSEERRVDSAERARSEALAEAQTLRRALGQKERTGRGPQDARDAGGAAGGGGGEAPRVREREPTPAPAPPPADDSLRLALEAEVARLR